MRKHELVNRFYKVVFVKFEDCDKAYTYLVPTKATVAKGDKVFVPCKYNELVAECICDCITVNVDQLKAILDSNGIDYIKEVTGMAVLQKYTKVEF